MIKFSLKKNDVHCKNVKENKENLIDFLGKGKRDDWRWKAKDVQPWEGHEGTSIPWRGWKDTIGKRSRNN